MGKTDIDLDIEQLGGEGGITPLRLDKYKILPVIGQEVTKVWKEKGKRKAAFGYIVVRIYYNRFKVLTIVLRGPEGYNGESDYLNFCKNFQYLGDELQPEYYEAN